MTEWPKTGAPAHNEAQRRSEEDIPQANPECLMCGGKGMLYEQRWDPHQEVMVTEMDACPCIFKEWKPVPDPTCSQCNGTGAVQERLAVRKMGVMEEAIFYHDCVCMRYVEIRRGEDDAHQG